MDYTSVSIKDTRDNLADIIDRVAVAGESFLVTKFGKVKAMITPMIMVKRGDNKEKILKSTFGMWKDRKDMSDSAKWVRDLRNKEANRYDKIFN